MMRNVIQTLPTSLRAAINARRQDGRRFFYDNLSSSSEDRLAELPRVDSLVEGCDYEHWIVVMHPPENYPSRKEIFRRYVSTLAKALGSEEAAREVIYAASTKYYYAFSCKVDQEMANRIKSLSGVKWVLPDSFFGCEESGYGGEPFVNGNLYPYDYKYHADWLQTR